MTWRAPVLAKMVCLKADKSQASDDPHPRAQRDETLEIGDALVIFRDTVGTRIEEYSTLQERRERENRKLVTY